MVKCIIYVLKGATKLYFTHYSSVVVILIKRVYAGLHFLPILLENYFFIFLSIPCFLF